MNAHIFLFVGDRAICDRLFVAFNLTYTCPASNKKTLPGMHLHIVLLVASTRSITCRLPGNRKETCPPKCRSCHGFPFSIQDRNRNNFLFGFARPTIVWTRRRGGG